MLLIRLAYSLGVPYSLFLQFCYKEFVAALEDQEYKRCAIAKLRCQRPRMHTKVLKIPRKTNGGPPNSTLTIYK